MELDSKRQRHLNYIKKSAKATTACYFAIAFVSTQIVLLCLAQLGSRVKLPLRFG
jgi:hypothetical protein